MRFFRGIIGPSDHLTPKIKNTTEKSEVPQPHHCVQNDLAWGGTLTCHQGREGLLMNVAKHVLFIKNHPWTVPYYRSYQVLPVLPNSKRPFLRVEWKMIFRLGKRWMDSAWLLHFSVPMFVELHWAEGCNVAYMLHHCLKFMIADGPMVKDLKHGTISHLYYSPNPTVSLNHLLILLIY